MHSPDRAASAITACLGILLVLPGLGVAGLSVLEETGADFSSGTPSGVQLHDGALRLEPASPPVPNWTKLGEGRPGGREYHAMVFDNRNNVFILFGGRLPDPGRTCDTWSYDARTGRWAEMNPPARPAGRHHHAMAFDERNGVAVLFGGNWIDDPLNDTWTYNLTANRWTRMDPPSSPPFMEDPVMAYDSESGLVVLYGWLRSGPGVHGETWTYDVSANIWTQKDPTRTAPTITQGTMAFDKGTDKVILVGIHTDWYMVETWTYDVANDAWMNATKDTLPPRSSYAMTYDCRQGLFVLFGGFYSNGSEPVMHAETWTYDIRQGTWTNATPGFSPPARADGEMAYDSLNGASVLFGGGEMDAWNNDVWAYNSTQNLWTEHVPVAEPQSREGGALAYHARAGEFVLFGGETRSVDRSRNDTWTYDPGTGTWADRNPVRAPPGRTGHGMVYDGSHGKMLLFGGVIPSSNNIYFNDTWQYDLATNTWTNLSPKNPPAARCYFAMTFDEKNGVAVLFGGMTEHGQANDTWTYSPAQNTWMETRPPAAPPAGLRSMAYDSSSGLVYLIGGYYSYNLEMWSYDVGKNLWTGIGPENAPPPRDSGSFVYDQSSGIFVLFGGSNHSAFFDDTWLYDPEKNSWTCVTIPAAPTARYGQMTAYDPEDDIVLLFGGYGRYLNWNLGDTWAFTLEDDYANDGSFVSRPFDTGGAAYFGSLGWDSLLPPGTGIGLQLRTGNSRSELEGRDFVGPDATSRSFYLGGDRTINAVHNGSRWFQYRSSLGTLDSTKTPILKRVTIRYNMLQELLLISPAGNENWSGMQTVSWNASDKDEDPLAFDIYLESDTARLPLMMNLSNSTRQWPWNTTGIPNGTYRMRIVARDDNSIIPLAVNATSGNFTIWHPAPPPPNHPPRVELVSPPNNSYLPASSARLRWKGADADGDPLNYTVRYSFAPLSQGNVMSNVTTAEYLDIAGLGDNETYYWTVDATDGRESGTGVLAETWCFMVRLPPGNIPVRINSAPPLQAWTGVEYAYNVTSTDEDGDIPAFSLVFGPQGMTMNSSTGRLRWTPAASDAGNRSVTVQASDGRGSFDRQTFTITVIERPAPPAQKPSCAIGSLSNDSKVSGRVLITGTARNGSLPITIVQVRVDNGAWQTAVGLGNWSITLDFSRFPDGRHRIEARAFDGILYSDTASVQVDVKNPEPSTTIGKPPWSLVGVIIAIAAGVGIYLVFRRRKGS